MITAIVGGDPDMRARRALTIAEGADRTVAVQPAPVYGFRGLLGWNLGLGLGDEACGLAGQFARRLGLGDVLAEPIESLESDVLGCMALARLLARPEEMLVHAPDLPGHPDAMTLVAEVGARRHVVIAARTPFDVADRVVDVGRDDGDEPDVAE